MADLPQREAEASSDASSSLQRLIDDMRLPNEGQPHGVDADQPGMEWAYGPRLAYGNEPPLDWTNMRTWGQVYEEAQGSPAENVRFQIRNMQAWYLSKASGQWVQWEYSSNIEGANYVEDFSEDQSRVADIRGESDQGGGISATLVPGYNFHFWIGEDRPYMDPADVAGVWVSIESRLIEDDPDRPYDLDQARLIFGAGADYWKSADAQFSGWENPSNGDIGIGRLRFLSDQWQAFNMHTLTEEQLAENPPPFDQ